VGVVPIEQESPDTVLSHDPHAVTDYDPLILRGKSAMPLFSTAGPFNVMNLKREKSDVSRNWGRIILPSFGAPAPPAVVPVQKSARTVPPCCSKPCRVRSRNNPLTSRAFAPLVFQSFGGMPIRRRDHSFAGAKRIG
jgi:hypothetical protein